MAAKGKVRKPLRKAAALEMYARQSKNIDAERQAASVRLRAERRAGELLKELQRTPRQESVRAGGKGAASVASPSPYREALTRTGIGSKTASRYEALANVPQPIFDEALHDPERKPKSLKPPVAGSTPAAAAPDRAVRITDGTLIIKFAYSAAMAEVVSRRFPRIGPDVFKASSLRCCNAGLLAESDEPKLSVTIAPFGWKEFIAREKLGTFSIAGGDAKALYGKFISWGEKREADSAIFALQSGEETVREILRQAPRLKRNATFLETIGALMIEQRLPKKVGRRPGEVQPNSVSALIEWVDVLHAEHGLSIVDAIARALKDHAALMPADWSSGNVDAHEALAKAHQRYHAANRKKYKL